MTITHDLTTDDVKNCHAMLRMAAPPAPSRGVALASSTFCFAGVLVLAYWWSLSLWQVAVLVGFTLGLAGLILLAVKRAAAKAVADSGKGSLGRRDYVVADGVLEVRMEDLTRSIPAKSIQSLESSERGTLVHLLKSPPLFLPFGDRFHGDFIQAVRECVEEYGRQNHSSDHG
jgi:hypothetical protein